jgi:site-specific DNA recombinase
MIRQAAIYCRLSQDRTGAGVVVERQERACRELAASLGYDVAEVYVDNDVSAYGRKPRPRYRQMLEDVKAGRVGAVVTYHSDRLYRHPMDLEELVALAEAHALKIATVQAGDIDLSTSAGRHVARILGSTARVEVERLAERTAAGKADAASRGAWNGGQRIYGYEVVPVAEREPDGSALRVVAEEAEVVQDAARRVLAGESLRSVARLLNEAGKTTTTGRLWTGSALRKVLVRPATAGLRASGGEVVGKGQWEPLLPEDEWRGLLAVLSDPSRRTTERYARTYLGSGLYLCGVCGGPLTGNTTAGGGPGGRRAAYRCRAADRDGQSHVVRDVERLDAFVVEVLVRRLSQPDALAASAPPPADTTPLHREAEALRARLDEAARGWAAGALTQAQLLAATAELRRRLEEVEARIGQARRGSALDGLSGTEDVRAAWEGMSLDRRRALLDLLAEVTVIPRSRTGRLPGGMYFDPASVDIAWKGAA